MRKSIAAAAKKTAFFGGIVFMILFINTMFLLFFKTPVYGATNPDSSNVVFEKAEEISAKEGGVTAVLRKSREGLCIFAHYIVEYIKSNQNGVLIILDIGLALLTGFLLLFGMFLTMLNHMLEKRAKK